MEPVNGVEEEERADPLVEIFAVLAESLERLALREELLVAGCGADVVERTMAQRVVRRGDEIEKSQRHARQFVASNSTSPRSTSSRSLPLRARASCALSKPYFTPKS